MRAPAFLAVARRMHGDHGLVQQVVQFQRLDQVRIPHERAVRDLDVAPPGPGLRKLLATLLQHLAGAEDGAVGLHGALHLEAQGGGRHRTVGMAQAVEAIQGEIGRTGGQGPVGFGGIDDLGAMVRGGAAEDDEVEQGVRAQAVRTVDRDAGRLADRHQAGHHGIGLAVLQGHDLAPETGRDAAHVVVAGRQHGDRLLGHVHAGEDLGRVRDARQALVQDRRVQMLQVQVDMVGFRPDAPALANLDGHGAGDDIARGQVLGAWGIALHEALALGIGQITALAPGALGDQAAGAVDAGRVELDELHVLQAEAGAQHHGVAVARAGMGRGAGEIRPAVAAGRQHRHLAEEAVDRAVGQAPRDDAAAGAVVRVHDQVDGEEFDEELGVVLERLLVEGMEDRMARAVRRGAGALGRALAIVGRHAAEGALVDLALRRAREGHAVMLQLDDRGHRLAHHVLDGVLVAQPVRALDRVVHVPAPVVLAHVAEGGADSALGRDRMAAGRKDLGEAGRAQALLRHAEGGAQAGAAAAHDDDVVFVVDDVVGLGHRVFTLRRRV